MQSSAQGPVVLAATGRTGNNTETAVAIPEGYTGGLLAILFVVEAIGATPTVTYKVQGALAATPGTNDWFDVILLPSDSETAAVSKTVTAVGAYAAFVSQAHSRFVPKLRVVTSANTNVTYRAELYALGRY